MAAVDLEEIRKRYNFKQISVATWRNPGGSILPARGGPQPLVISAEAAGKPFIPSYKVRYPLPQPTDDEDSESGEDDESEPEGTRASSTVFRHWLINVRDYRLSAWSTSSRDRS